MIKAINAIVRDLNRLLSRPALLDTPMAAHTVWKIGGTADCMVLPGDEAELSLLLGFLRQRDLPWVVVGNGSNLLVGDSGIRDIVIKLAPDYGGLDWRGGGVYAGAGVLLNTMVLEAARMGYTGMEFLAGIPGSLGGAVRMNAGAFGGQIGQLVNAVTCVDITGRTVSFGASDMRFGYRSCSILSQSLIISGVGLTFAKSDEGTSAGMIKDYLSARAKKQPLEYPSCGSVFRNPPNDHAGRLIEAAGLRGIQIGQAMISPKHGNFIVNLGGATAGDVLGLITLAKRRVSEQFDIDLKLEVKLLGEFDSK